MVTPKEIKMKTMTPEKRAEEKHDLFAYYVERPISYVLTIPFVYLKLTPNQITMISLIPQILAFAVSFFASNKTDLIIMWCLYFLWTLLDFVDGNIARYKKQYSKYGEVYDAMIGYAAMFLTFFSAGIATSKGLCMVGNIPIERTTYIILGALSGVFQIFPRLVMHKTFSSLMDRNSVIHVKDKATFGFAKVVALNIATVTSGAQLFMLVAIVFGILDFYTIGYFIINLLVMLISIKSILSLK